MSAAHDLLFRTLADPTRRAIFERLCREQAYGGAHAGWKQSFTKLDELLARAE